MNNFKNWVIVILLLVVSNSSYAQRAVQGMLRDSSFRIASGASVKLISNGDTVGTSSSVGGLFRFDNVKGNLFKIKINSLGFEPFEQEYTYPTGENNFVIPTILLKGIPNMLEEVVVNGVVSIQVKGDTVEYAMDNLKLRQGAVAEDALKKLQGVEVDKDGAVTAQGEQVTRVRINGKDFFGGDVKTATQNLPAEIIQKIQIVDDFGDMANLTGNKSGESTKVLNIQIDPKYNNGYATTLRVGGGTEERYQATGMLMGFKAKSQVSILGNLNNMNAPLFDFNSMGGGARGRQGGGGRPGGGAFGGSQGITNTGSIGVNLRHDFSDKLKVYGSYSYGRDDNNTLSKSFTEYIGQNLTQDAETNNNGILGNHRFEANLEWNITEKDYIKITPQLGYSDNSTNNLSNSIYYSGGIKDNSQLQTTLGEATTPRYNVSGLYNRRLNDKGRNIFFNFNYDNANTKNDVDQILDRAIYDGANQNTSVTEIYERTIRDAQNKSWNAGASVSYLEPLSDKSKLEIAYDYNTNDYDNYDKQIGLDKQGNSLNDPQLNYSYDYDYGFTTHRVGASFIFENDKLKYSFGAAVQPSILKGNAYSATESAVIDRTNFNIIPIARFEYKFSRQSNVSFNYSGRSSEPGVSQILPFEVSTNRTNTTIGNPNLNPEFRHSMAVRFRTGDFQKGKSFFATVKSDITQNKIVSLNKRYLNSGVGIIQDVGYINSAEPAVSITSFYHLSRSLKEKTYNIMYGGGVNYARTISYLTSDENAQLANNPNALGFDKGVNNNTTIFQMLFFRYNPSEFLEINPGLRYNYNITSSTLPDFEAPNSQKITPTLIASVNLTKSTIFGVDLSKEFNSGFRTNVNPFIINTYIEQKLLKGQRGALRLQAFDLLNQQTNINRTVGEVLTDTQTNRLARYFMLTFTFKLQKFSGINPMQEQGQFPGGMRPPRM
ncbi:outer membrane beta-barrel protein [Sphingobacterium rhinopitheci]|uniref:outer membrane beta-barrel protein n=1 Tax=Sphingobacterium rhinopitheci TaxID=2781960 RepID=UPI001F525745|nr:outer membrane beta-barrel protein [Sphingobacterium rhinopitheci]MCI0921484.1 outer membrane beta-barrel protein [Sphingobacterium rhinopitheci]